MSREKVGVLAVQGAFVEHQSMLEKLGVNSVQIRSRADLAGITRLILPGGESTVQGKLLVELELLTPLQELVRAGMPVLGTCAGMILLSAQIDAVDGSFVHALGRGTEEIEAVRARAIEQQRSAAGVTKRTGAPRLGTLDICVRRNAYGRQLGSFKTTGQLGELGDVPMTFIRAPFVTALGPQVEELASVDGHVVACRQGAQLATSFHPELDSDLRVHEMFMQL